MQLQSMRQHCQQEIPPPPPHHHLLLLIRPPNWAAVAVGEGVAAVVVGTVLPLSPHRRPLFPPSVRPFPLVRAVIPVTLVALAVLVDLAVLVALVAPVAPVDLAVLVVFATVTVTIRTLLSLMKITIKKLRFLHNKMYK